MDATILGKDNEIVNVYSDGVALVLDVDDSVDACAVAQFDVTGATLLRDALNEFLREQGQRGK